MPYPIVGGSAIVSPDEKYAILIPTFLDYLAPCPKESVFLMDGKTFAFQGIIALLITFIKLYKPLNFDEKSRIMD